MTSDLDSLDTALRRLEQACLGRNRAASVTRASGAAIIVARQTPQPQSIGSNPVRGPSDANLNEGTAPENPLLRSSNGALPVERVLRPQQAHRATGAAAARTDADAQSGPPSFNGHQVRQRLDDISGHGSDHSGDGFLSRLMGWARARLPSFMLRTEGGES